jgi:O-antigen ligase
MHAPFFTFMSMNPILKKASIVHLVVMLLVWVAVLFPAWPEPLLWGVLWTGVGCLMVFCPPVATLPRSWYACCGGFIAAGLLGFLPGDWFSRPAWRGELEALGAGPGGRAFVQPRLAAEGFLSLAVSAVAVLYLCGHRLDSLRQQRLMLAHSCGLALIALLALAVREEGGVFGFFPNRNHMATLLATGSFCGLAAFAHAIRKRSGVSGVLSCVAAVTCTAVMLLHCESRAGLVLLGGGVFLWLGLMGLRQLTGQTGRAVALAAFAMVGTFLVVDSTAKRRLLDSMTGAVVPAQAAAAGDGQEDGGEIEIPATLDSRITIFRDTLRMIAEEPWSGVGTGQFRYVFPQYRVESKSPHMSVHVHPESDWLWLAAETGVVAAGFVALGLILVVGRAFRGVLRSRSRPLVTGGLVAASMVLFHGWFDVPGHQVGLAWGAGLLLAMSLRGEGHSGIPCGRRVALAWRFGGVAIGAAGLFLLGSRLAGHEVLEISRAKAALEEVSELYRIDSQAADTAEEEGTEYEPAPEEDPLRKAIAILEARATVTPLDPQIHKMMGIFGAHVGVDPAMVERSFAIQSRLLPSRVGILLEQARAWYPIDPDRASACWREALARARNEQRRHPDSEFNFERTCGKILNEIRYDEGRMRSLLELAGEFPDLMLPWAGAANRSLLDATMPGILAGMNPEMRAELLERWRKRGGKAAVESYLRAHEE